MILILGYQNNMKKKILITGSAGYLGSALFEILRDSYIVYGIDIKDRNDLFNIKSITGVDIVIHCAALTSVTESIKNPREYYKQNVLGTAHIVKLCLKENAQLIYISSAAIFDPFANVYADSKELAHEIVDKFQDALHALIFIPYNIYSLQPKKGTLFHHFLTDPELYIYGSGKQTRDFISIVDVCNIIKTAIDEEWEADTFELGTGKATRVKDIADIFHEETNKKRIFRKQSGGVKNSVADIRHLREYYSKPFKTNLKKDIKEMSRKVN
jgi:UDP-glucose 4-epimerase